VRIIQTTDQKQCKAIAFQMCRQALKELIDEHSAMNSTVYRAILDPLAWQVWWIKQDDVILSVNC
jgi:hypothetical protein